MSNIVIELAGYSMNDILRPLADKVGSVTTSIYINDVFRREGRDTQFNIKKVTFEFDHLGCRIVIKTKERLTRHVIWKSKDVFKRKILGIFI
jgi:hypothetical protein